LTVVSLQPSPLTRQNSLFPPFFNVGINMNCGKIEPRQTKNVRKMLWRQHAASNDNCSLSRSLDDESRLIDHILDTNDHSWHKINQRPSLQLRLVPIKVQKTSHNISHNLFIN